MSEAEENRALIVFTSLAPLSVGGFAGLLAIGADGTAGKMVVPLAVMLAVGVLALAASLLHLGRPFRAPWAIVHCSSSWLSREVILFGMYLAALALYGFSVASNLWTDVLGFLGPLAALFGLLGVYATGRVYQLRARPAWDHWTATMAFPLSAVSSGVLFGVAVALSFPGIGADGGIVAALSAVSALSLVVGLGLTWFRFAQMARSGAEERKSLQLGLGRYRWAVVLRVAGALLALALISMGGAATVAAWVPAALGEAAERVLFFCTVVPVTLSGRSGARRAGWGPGESIAGEEYRGRA